MAANKTVEFRKFIKSELGLLNEYKELLKVCKEEQMDYYTASQTVFKYTHPDVAKPTADDYKEINKLRKWYEELEV